eukprot:2600109-Alexandrium_andersonii.AAC.1
MHARVDACDPTSQTPVSVPSPSVVEGLSPKAIAEMPRASCGAWAERPQWQPAGGEQRICY